MERASDEAESSGGDLEARHSCSYDYYDTIAAIVSIIVARAVLWAVFCLVWLAPGIFTPRRPLAITFAALSSHICHN